MQKVLRPARLRPKGNRRLERKQEADFRIRRIAFDIRAAVAVEIRLVYDAGAEEAVASNLEIGARTTAHRIQAVMIRDVGVTEKRADVRRDFRSLVEDVVHGRRNFVDGWIAAGPGFQVEAHVEPVGDEIIDAAADDEIRV